MARTRSAARDRLCRDPGLARSSSAPDVSLLSDDGSSPKLLIMPKRASSQARILSLPHPRSAQPTRYLLCPESGIYELSRMASPPSTPASWLIEAEAVAQPAVDSDAPGGPEAQVLMSPDLFVATPMDPLFLLLPALSLPDAGASTADEGTQRRRLFLSCDDHLDKLPNLGSHILEVLQSPGIRTLFQDRMSAVCDVVEAGDEPMFRLSDEKLAITVLDKAKRMSETGLPASMEERFVKRTLEAPLLLPPTRLAVASTPALVEGDGSEVSTPQTESTNSLSVATTADNSTSSHPASSTVASSTVASSIHQDDASTETILDAVEASPEVVRLQRLRVALDFICATYMSSATTKRLQSFLERESVRLVDYSPLDKYLAELARLRAEAVALRTTADFSLKRGLGGDEDEDARASKKRKEEEEKKRRAKESRGVRELKKVDTRGMKKMSDFFKAKAK